MITKVTKARIHRPGIVDERIRHILNEDTPDSLNGQFGNSSMLTSGGGNLGGGGGSVDGDPDVPGTWVTAASFTVAAGGGTNTYNFGPVTGIRAVNGIIDVDRTSYAATGFFSVTHKGGTGYGNWFTRVGSASGTNGIVAAFSVSGGNLVVTFTNSHGSEVVTVFIKYTYSEV